MKQLVILALALLALAGCKDRVIWDDNGKVEEATKDRKVWDSNGKIDTGERKVWNREDGEPVVE